MKIGIVGGTGREGRGLAVRWAKAGHDVFIGSRQTEKGVAKAAEFAAEFDVSLRGGDNVAACNNAELIVVTVPYSAHRATFDSIKDAVGDKVIVDITVPLQPPKVRSVNLPDGQAAALHRQRRRAEQGGIGGGHVPGRRYPRGLHVPDADQRLILDGGPGADIYEDSSGDSEPSLLLSPNRSEGDEFAPGEQGDEEAAGDPKQGTHERARCGSRFAPTRKSR